MAVRAALWKLASPYDAYVAHVGRLNDAIERLRYHIDRALGYEAGLHGSVRFVPAERDAEDRARQFRDRLASAASEMSEDQFDDFMSHLGGGSVANVEDDRARTISRLGHTTRGLEEYFAAAAHELAVLEERGYNPGRPDVARQLRANNLSDMSVADYRHLLGRLGAQVGKRPK
jgi:hypothetical protein